MIREKPIVWNDELYNSASTLFDKYLTWVQMGIVRLNADETQLTKQIFFQLKGREISGGCTGCVVDGFVTIMSLYENEHRKRTTTIMESMAQMLTMDETPTTNEINEPTNAIAKKKPRRIKK